MSIAVDVDIVLPLGMSTLVNEPEPGLSITRSARELARIISTSEVSRVRLVSVGHLPSLPKATKASILYCFRPADLDIWKQETQGATHTAMLVHEQDKILGFDNLKDHVRGKVVAFNTRAAEWISTRIDSKPVLIPLPYPMQNSNLSKEWVADVVSKTTTPKLVLWLGPHIRKNSLDGLFATLEAVKTYGDRVNIVIVVASSGGFPAPMVYNLLDNIPLVNNANIEVLSSPTEDQKFKLLSSASVVVFPSFDEGYHIPVFEALPFLPSIVMSKCDANMDIASIIRHPQKCYLFERTEQELVGSNADEIGFRPWTIQIGDYFSMVDQITLALREWNLNTSVRANMLRQGYFLNTNMRNEASAWMNLLSIKPRRKGVGRAYVQTV